VLSDDEQAKAGRSTGSAVAAASVAFFLAELGDKTMLAIITLSTRYGWEGVWLGSTPGMVAADALAIVVGRQLGRHLPEKSIKVGASALFFLFGMWLLVDALAQLNDVSPADAVARALDHHLAGWIALGLGLVAGLLGVVGRGRMRRVGAVSRQERPTGRTGAWSARALFGLAMLLGFVAPLLVATDVVQPIALFDEPGWVAGGAAVLLLGTALLLAAQAQRVALQAQGADPVSATGGLHARVRNPGLTGIVVATAGLLLMVPTLLGVLAAVLVVVAVQVQVRAVREAGTGAPARGGLRRLRGADRPVPAPARAARG
jgi:protein-S-isoprenylcysteine O-methyltransferase Ste14